jgi:hypothetical protein
LSGIPLSHDTIQSSLPLVFSVASASGVPGKRYAVMFDGDRWCCTCEFYRRIGRDCRHILEKRLETKTTGVFAGAVYEPLVDEIRLTRQSLRVFRLMADGEWRSLSEIAEVCHDPPASINAQLRHFRKRRFGSHQVDKRRCGNDSGGLWEYRLVVNSEAKMFLGSDVKL